MVLIIDPVSMRAFVLIPPTKISLSFSFPINLFKILLLGLSTVWFLPPVCPATEAFIGLKAYCY